MRNISQLLKYLVCGATAVLAASCINSEIDQTIQTPEREAITLSALIDGKTPSRIEFTDDPANKRLSLEWSNEGEQFTMVHTSTLATSSFAQIPGTNNFSGALPASEDEELYSYDLLAIYPNVSISQTELLYDISQQSGALESRNIVMLGYALDSEYNDAFEITPEKTDVFINFFNAVSLLKPTFTYKGESINSEITHITVELPKRASSIMKFDLTTAKVIKKNSIEISIDKTSENIYISLLGTMLDTILDENAPANPMLNGETLFFSITTADGAKYTARLAAKKDIEFSKIYTATIPTRKLNTDPEFVWYYGIPSSAPEDIDGTGTEEDPIRIYTANDLQLLIDCVRYPELVAEMYGEEYAAFLKTAHFKLTHDLTIQSSGQEPWTPIGGHLENPFYGTFDGDNHIIDGEMVYDGSFDVAGYEIGFPCFGFFGLNAGTIKNLNIKANVLPINVPAFDFDGTGMICASGIAAANTGDIIHCTNCGKIHLGYKKPLNTTTTLAIITVGGITGVSANLSGERAKNLLIQECTNYGEISTDDHNYSAVNNIISTASGICGITLYKTTIDRCSNEGNVYGANADEHPEAHLHTDEDEEGWDDYSIVSWHMASGIVCWSNNREDLFSQCVNRGDIYGGDARFNTRRMSMTTVASIAVINSGVVANNSINYGRVIEGIGGEDVGLINKWDWENDQYAVQPTRSSKSAHRPSIDPTTLNIREVCDLVNNKTRGLTLRLQAKEHTLHGNVIQTNDGYICTCCKNLNTNNDNIDIRFGNNFGDTKNLPDWAADMVCPGTH